MRHYLLFTVYNGYGKYTSLIVWYVSVTQEKSNKFKHSKHYIWNVKIHTTIVTITIVQINSTNTFHKSMMISALLILVYGFGLTMV